MKWSWKILSLAGIGVYVHWTFAILVVWVLVAHLRQGESIAVALYGLAFVLAVFACVVLHELGHALTARRFGIKTRDITLLPIGGVARLERMPEEPRQELLVAIAGPAVNVVLAAVFFVLALVVGQFRWVGEMETVGTDVLGRLFWVNTILVIFNLLPAFPMDGGRVLRAFLAQRMSYERATNVAANVGQAMAIGFGILGFFVGNPFLFFIAFFVYLGAQAEAQFVQIRKAFSGAPVRDAMVTRFRSLSAAEPLTTAIEELLAGSQTDFPVVDDGRVSGMLFRNDLFKALSDDGGKTRRVADVMKQDCEIVEESDSLEETYQRLRQSSCPALPVVKAGELVGLLTAENISEYVLVRNALRAREEEA